MLFRSLYGLGDQCHLVRHRATQQHDRPQGELPERLDKPIWHRPLIGLFISAAATLVLANILDLASISTMGSVGFLIIFGVVNAAEPRTSQVRDSSAPISVGRWHMNSAP